MNEKLTNKERIELVQAAIDRIKEAKIQYVLLSADPSVGPHRIASFKMTVDMTINEFGLQWENVERLLAEGTWRKK